MRPAAKNDDLKDERIPAHSTAKMSANPLTQHSKPL
jgi:hypothetical protein